MIAAVAGRVRALSLDSAVVDVGGVGLRVQATPTTLASLRVGASAELSTTLVVREDALTLFGFSDEEERDAFEMLQTVSGVGPRLALAMLAVHPPDQLRRAVATEDLAALMRVPGIGRKGAQRIVLEIGDRLGPPASGEPAARPGESTKAAADGTSEVVEALVGLGWPARSAEQAVAGALEDGHPGTDTAMLLRAALRSLGGHGSSGTGAGARG